MESEHNMGGETKMYHYRMSPVMMLVVVIVVLFSFWCGVMFGEIRGQFFCNSSGGYGSFGPGMMYRSFGQDGSYGSFGPGMMWGGNYQQGGQQQQQLNQPLQGQESVPSAQTVQ